jgi:hypothetical protein
MDYRLRESDRVGLCASCKHVRVVRSDRDSVFYQCKRAATDPRFAQYPTLPVLRCPGYEAEDPRPQAAAPKQL